MTVNRRQMLALLASATATRTGAQGFAGLGTAEDGFAMPERGTMLRFPADHGPHPEFRIEWWYLTANLRGPDGTQYGAQWTLFRSAQHPGEAPGWTSPQIWMGHAAVTTPDAHHFAEKFARGGVGQAGARAAPFEAWIDDWRLHGPDLQTLRVEARGDAFSYALDLTATGPLVLHGDRGYSVKSADGQASYYYSQPAYTVTGLLDLETPIPLTGQAWLDREWSSQPLAPDQTGWDWFSLSLDSGDRLMAFRLRGARGDFLSGTWISPSGETQSLLTKAFTLTPIERSEVAGRSIPTTWRLQLPNRALDIEVAAQNPQAWMGTSVAYWEGPVTAYGSHPGQGYLEMTGY